ncbi:MAG: PSD1 domain-containing protein [Acidobacteria bacterium]|nr:PSD1 domain-containing protein [Acidobacteriota bacterium]
MFPRVLLLSFYAAAGFCAVSFNRDVRPIMSNTCFQCHGPDKSSRMAGLRLDLRDEALRKTASGVTPIVPGNPEQSAIVERIFSSNAAKMMPPKYAHKELSAAQKNVIKQWVAEGANYEGHWAYQPVRRPEVPAVPGGAVRNPIDAFVQQRLAREGLKPSAEADKRTLIRRVTFDLTGLPATPQDVSAFEKDTAPDAYEKLVDRLLSSERYAEKQAMHWLDAVRYADTCGFHGDNPFPIWPYRDYVLQAFRNNKPFDVFTREQLAGDLMPNATEESRIASAYNRLNRTSAEGGIQPKEYLAKYGADRVRTTASVWLGSTIGCSECHDHKFDPFLSRDFYSMKAFFADIEETGLVPDRGAKAWGTQLTLPTSEQKARRQDLEARIEAARKALDERTASFAARRADWEKEVLSKFEGGWYNWQFQRPVSASTANGAKLTIFNDEPVEMNTYSGASLTAEKRPGDGLMIASGANPDRETYTVTLKPGLGSWMALGLEVVQDESLPGIRVARGSDRLVVTEIEAELDGRKIPFSLATASFTGVSPEYPALGAIDGNPKTAWGIATYGENRNLFLALRFTERLATTASSRLIVRLKHDSDYRRATLGRFRLALSSAAYSWPEPEEARNRRKTPTHGVPDDVIAGLRKAADQRSEEQRKAINAHFQWMDTELQASFIELEKLQAELGILDASVTRVVVTQATEPRETRVLPRGNWMDDAGELVQPAIPGFLGKLQASGRATRLDLANWLVSSDNPLTARVQVNRTWRLLFGTGLSKVLEDLGSQGEWPTHPELLDWMAAEFQEKWDYRNLVRTIVLSHTYRQSSLVSKELEERDPDNRLLARQTRFRVDAESVRDVALSISGLLVEKFGGPSVRPYQPEGYLAALNFPKRDYSASVGPDLYRRGLYSVWQRTFLHPSLMTFDAPSREECAITRVNSNTPLQALVLLNDPTFVEAARVFAQHILAQKGAAAKQLDWAFQQALQRRPSAEEGKVLLDLYQKSLAGFRKSKGDALKLIQTGDAPVASVRPAEELAAMTTVARAILNLHETITRN